MRLVHAVLLLLVIQLTVAGAEAQPLVGERIRGATVTVSEGQVQIGEQTYPLARLAWLAVSDEAPPADSELAIAASGILLRQAGYLPALQIDAGLDDASLLVTSPFGSFTVPLAEVQAFGQRPQVLTAPTTSEQDLLVLVDGQQLAGELLGVAAEGLRMRTDLADEALVIAWEQLGVLRLRGATVRDRGLCLRLRHDPGLPPLYLAPATPWHLLGLPAAEIASTKALPRLMVEGGATQPLSGLDPVAVQEEGAFAVTWEWTRDVQIDGRPLELNGQRFERGLCLHSAAQLDWDLGGHYIHFAATLGIADSLGYEGDCVVRILIDDEQRWQRRLRGGDEAQRCELPLTGAQRLSIVVDFGERYDIGDHVVVAEPILVRQ